MSGVGLGAYRFVGVGWLLAIGLIACRPSPAPVPSAQGEVAEAVVEAPGEAPEVDRGREHRAAARALRKAAFAEDLAIYDGIRASSTRPATRAAAWRWIVAAWQVVDAGDEPDELVWHDEAGLPMVPGRPVRLTVDLGASTPLSMTWVRPGLFRMGSPEGEPGRYSNETPHSVVISEGYWIGRFEVTQQQWERIMGTQPSHFALAGPEAPVEQVSWRDAQDFLRRLNHARLDTPAGGLWFRLPSEAEWEYACRAGTDEATYAGPVEMRGANDAPALDPIAWYGGNSGVDYPGGWDSSSWAEKQYDHRTAGTHPVGLKAPNAWGLYDTLGNVWEWCAESFYDYPADASFDPVGPHRAEQRVARGGCWGNQAAACRAAVRNPLPPDARLPRVGFRLAAHP